MHTVHIFEWIGGEQMAGFTSLWTWDLDLNSEGDYVINTGSTRDCVCTVYDPDDPQAASSTTFRIGDIIKATPVRSDDHFYFRYVAYTGDGWVGNYLGNNPDNLIFGDPPYYKLYSTERYDNDGTTPITWTAENFTFCFLEGTLIDTPHGARPIESLKAGDEILDAEGRSLPVKWIGRHKIVTVFADPLRSYPIRIQAGALADQVPRRDLFLSPAHALLIDGLLVQASALVNGTTITRVTKPAERFTYYHIETAGHVVILAEGAPAETFVDSVSRQRFDNYPEFVALFGTPGSSMEELDQPRVKSPRQLPETIRARLAARAKELSADIAA